MRFITRTRFAEHLNENSKTPERLTGTCCATCLRRPRGSASLRACIELALCLLCLLSTIAVADEPALRRQVDVIYGRKHGMALTMDVFSPRQQANGRGVISVISGGWFSSHDLDGILPYFTPLVDRGYTVFAVVHGSQPKYAIPEMIEDMERAVRFIRFHAQDYGIDDDYIGIYGSSAGGHLALMQGTAGDEGDPKAADPIDRISSRVQAVVCFFPPTDFLNYGKPNEIALGRGTLWDFKAPFDFHEFDPKQKMFVKVTDEEKILAIGREISPINHVSADDPATLIFHGDKDWLVPIQQSESIVERFQQAGVEAKLVVKRGAEHGWPDTAKEMSLLVDWFDRHLKTPPRR
ncbi:MAG TPA: alpha/beta hydrolase [Pirellulales bacterium]|jgi:acetyl esterase/lipase|nr:alpha/beta hydrolase [Pirellulales bacterium]